MAKSKQQSAKSDNADELEAGMTETSEATTAVADASAGRETPMTLSMNGADNGHADESASADKPKRGRPTKAAAAAKANAKSDPKSKPAASPSAHAGSSFTEAGSVSGYFRKVFKQKPEWLFETSNDLVLKRFLKDHPEYTEVPLNIRNNLANLKSQLRKRVKSQNDSAAPATAAAVMPRETARPVGRPAHSHSSTQSHSKLEHLEEGIDDCLAMAKSLDRDGLRNVLELLRKARNAVVWKMSQ